MDFPKLLGLRPGVTAVIGSGGKTSLLRRLAEELPGTPPKKRKRWNFSPCPKSWAATSNLLSNGLLKASAILKNNQLTI